jgi:coenzyme F420 biosynthesis associated uncharacterized protein
VALSSIQTRQLSRGLAAAAVAGALYVASRRRASGPPPSLIDWEKVRTIATMIARRDSRSYDDVRAEYADMVGRSQRIIADYTREPLPVGTEHVYVFDRVQWLEANVAAFRELFEPVERINGSLLAGRFGGGAFGDVNQLVLSSQMGLLLGYLSRRVLGQYDLALLGREPVTTGRLYFVEPNILQLEARLGLVPKDFRLWIALHETTHAYEFEAHPWLRDHMNGLLRRYFDALGNDLGNLRSDLRGLGNFARRVGANLGQKGYAVELVMTPEQRTIFRALQALMCLLEGYSNHVMDAVGRDLLPSYGQMKERFESRLKKKGPAERLFAKLTGLDVKMEQYRLGERFVNEVVGRVGVAGMNRVWRGPDALPTLEEVREPRLWIERVGA